MKLVKAIYINGKEFHLVRDHVWLDLATPGRADFTIKSEEPLSGIVSFFMRDSGLEPMEIFTGYIEKSHMVDDLQQRIFCRELTAVLWDIIPVSIKNASLKDILNIFTRKTRLEFNVPQKEYSEIKHHTFQSVGNGIHALDSFGDIFKISNYIWQQQGNGKVYVGAWEDSKWSEREIDLSEKFFQDVQLDGTKTLQALPGLRPGVKLNGLYVNSLQLKEHIMVVKCEKQLRK